jgi:Na+/melibiose symporter-like transporter
MKDSLKQLAKGLLGSKKVAALLVGMLAALAQIPLIKWLGMPEEQATSLATTVSAMVVGLAATYILGQSAADLGKEAAKIEADARLVANEEEDEALEITGDA